MPKQKMPLESIIDRYRVRLKLEKPNGRPITRLMVERPKIKGKWPLIRSPDDAYHILKYLEQEPRELLIILCLDSDLRLTGIDEVAKGSSTEVRFKHYELYRAPILLNTPGIIMAHNHPGEHHVPSREDRKMNKSVMRTSNIMGIRVIDNMVIGYDSYYSFAEEGSRGIVPLNRKGQYLNEH